MLLPDSLGNEGIKSFISNDLNYAIVDGLAGTFFACVAFARCIFIQFRALSRASFPA